MFVLPPSASQYRVTMQIDVAALLFDIDGTLVDSTAAVERTWRTWAAHRGLDAGEILSVCHGRRAEDTIADLLPEGERAAAVVELESLELHDLDDVIALPGVQSLLGELPANRWAAVTSGSRRLMRARLAAAGVTVPRVLVGADDVVIGKPDPEGYLAAAAALGVAVADCLVVEDAPAGIAAGLSSGARVLAVQTSHKPAELADAHYSVPDLRSVSVSVMPDGVRITLGVEGERA